MFRGVRLLRRIAARAGGLRCVDGRGWCWLVGWLGLGASWHLSRHVGTGTGCRSRVAMVDRDAVVQARTTMGVVNSLLRGRAGGAVMKMGAWWQLLGRLWDRTVNDDAAGLIPSPTASPPNTLANKTLSSPPQTSPTHQPRATSQPWPALLHPKSAQKQMLRLLQKKRPSKLHCPTSGIRLSRTSTSQSA